MFQVLKVPWLSHRVDNLITQSGQAQVDGFLEEGATYPDPKGASWVEKGTWDETGRERRT